MSNTRTGKTLVFSMQRVYKGMITVMPASIYKLLSNLAFESIAIMGIVRSGRMVKTLSIQLQRGFTNILSEWADGK